jgi:hypothetical protein
MTRTSHDVRVEGAAEPKVLTILEEHQVGVVGEEAALRMKEEVYLLAVRQRTEGYDRRVGVCRRSSGPKGIGASQEASEYKQAEMKH